MVGFRLPIPNLLSPALPIFPLHWPLHSHPYILIPLDQWTSAQKQSISWTRINLTTSLPNTSLKCTPFFLCQSKMFLLHPSAQTIPSSWHPTRHPFLPGFLGSGCTTVWKPLNFSNLGCLTYTRWVIRPALLPQAAFVRTEWRNGREGALTSPKCFSNVFQFIVLFLGTAYKNTQGLVQSGAAWKTKCSLSCNMSVYAYDLHR